MNDRQDAYRTLIMNSILIVEDELHLAKGLRFNLEAEGYHVTVAHEGEAALKLILNHKFDAVLLDVMLPGKNGFEIAAELRRQENFIPILMLTARNRPEDVLRGFESGADDYLPKPFELAILIARLRGLLRRNQWSKHETTPPEIFTFAGKTLDFGALELILKHKTLRLTLMEAELLRYLILHDGQPVSRKAILEEVWGLREDTDTRAIDNFIVRLRKYIEDDPAEPQHLQTVRGVGYRFVAQQK
jgi:two-component system, OmpR family, alkaline phosphatase synthesis response regulator PhoP